jgi:hypothetical protein
VGLIKRIGHYLLVFLPRGVKEKLAFIIIIIIIISVSSQLSLWILESNSVGVVHACVRLTYRPDEGFVAMEH